MPYTGALHKIQHFILLLPGPSPQSSAPHPKKSHIPELAQHDFERRILKGSGRSLVLFSAVWCRQCQPLKEVVGAAARVFDGALAVYQMDFDQMTEDFQKRWNPQNHLPLILFFDGGRLAGTQAGSSPLNGEEKKTLRFSPSSFEKNRQRLFKNIQDKLKIKPPR